MESDQICSFLKETENLNLSCCEEKEELVLGVVHVSLTVLELKLFGLMGYWQNKNDLYAGERTCI